MAAARAARITRLDYFLLTHFHGDHSRRRTGSRQAPAGDHVRRLRRAVRERRPLGERTVSGVQIRPRRRQPAASGAGRSTGSRGRGSRGGDRGWRAAGEALSGTAGAGQANPACATLGKVYSDSVENEQSLGIRLKFGRFTFLDLGDLSGTKLAALACPRNLIGHADVYLVPHHGGEDAAIPAVIAAVSPRVAILNNGVNKGGDPETFASIRGGGGNRGYLAAAQDPPCKRAEFSGRVHRQPQPHRRGTRRRRVDQGQRHRERKLHGHQRPHRRDEVLQMKPFMAARGGRVRARRGGAPGGAGA